MKYRLIFNTEHLRECRSDFDIEVARGSKHYGQIAHGLSPAVGFFRANEITEDTQGRPQSAACHPRLMDGFRILRRGNTFQGPQESPKMPANVGHSNLGY
jgi:hypothetical protein